MFFCRNSISPVEFGKGFAVVIRIIMRKLSMSNEIQRAYTSVPSLNYQPTSELEESTEAVENQRSRASSKAGYKLLGEDLT